jgi:hypothetical protein
LGLATCTPREEDDAFAEWWRKARKKTAKEKRKGLNTLIMLGAWILWKHRNACVFEGVQPSIQAIIREFTNEQQLWFLAGARSLRRLGQEEAPG